MLFLALCGFLGIYKGADGSIEFSLYHFYNGWASLTGRQAQDFAFCGYQTYFNPLFDMMYYYFAKILFYKPYLFLFIQGVWSALGLFAIYKTISLFIKKYNSITISLIVSALFFVIYSFLFIYQVSSPSIDHQIAFLPLFAIYFVLNTIFFDDKINYKKIIISGLMLGIAVGLKHGSMIYVFSFVITFLIYWKKFDNHKKLFISFLTPIIFAYLLINGYWLFYLYKMYGNPIFPVYNNIFHSDYAINSVCLFPTRLPSFLKLFYPFIYDLMWQESFYNINLDDYYRSLDYKWAIAYSVILLYGISNIFSKFRYCKSMKLLQEYINMPIFNFLCVYISVVWVVWLNSFAVIRYLSALNFYLGIIISVALLFFSLLIKRPKTYFIFLFIFILLNIWTTMFFSWGKQIPHSLYEPVLDMKIPDNAVVLSAGLGVGYIAPFQNSKAHYVYGCTHLKENFNYSQKAFEKVRNLMKLGEVFVLYNKDRVDEDYSEIEIFTVPKSYNGDLNMLDRYQIDYDSCKFIHNLYGNKTYLCKVVKVKQEK